MTTTTYFQLVKSGFNQVEFDAYNFFDWFCKRSSLKNRGAILAKKASQIVMSNKFDCNSTYVIFKNNCPMRGPLYDDFRICDIKTGNVIFTVTPKDSHEGGKSVIWGRNSQNEMEEQFVGTWRDAVKWFMSN